MRSKIKDDINYRFVIRNPSQTRGNGNRASFGIIKREFNSGEVTSSKGADLKPISQEALDSINKRYTAGKLNFEDARKEVEELVENLYIDLKAVKAVVFNTANLKVLQEYLDSCYTEARRKKLSSYSSARSEAERAIEALGGLSIQTATPKQIQDQVDKSLSDNPNKQRRIIFKLRAILNWLRPSESWKHLLTPDNEEQGFVKYLTDEEFIQVRNKLPGELHKTLADVCFNLGCRVGEAVALTLSDLRETRNVVLIAKQITQEGHTKRTVKTKTKNKKIREAFVFPEGVPAIKKWIKIKDQFVAKERKRLAETMTIACRQIFPEDESKHLNWHDLRHCYAIRLLDKGLNIDDVADMIGDSVVVAKKHYVGFIISDARMERIRSKVLGK